VINKHDIKDMWPLYNNPLTYLENTTSKLNHDMLMKELDPNGKDAKTPGAKLDAGKCPVWQGLFDYFPMACQAVADVSAAGARKYAWKGWESVPDGVSRYRNAQGRHILHESIDGPFDPDGFRHLAQNAWNALAALELTLREEKNASK
jgi:hypothetical protein